MIPPGWSCDGRARRDEPPIAAPIALMLAVMAQGSAARLIEKMAKRTAAAE